MHVGLATGFAYQGRSSGTDADFIREEVENLVMADELGFDSVWMTEHHFTDYSMSNDPLQLLTYIAGKTRHVKLGTQCIIVPWHNPVRNAEAIVNLDILSNGRAILGFGGGLAQHEFAGLGIDQNQSRERYNDGLEMICSALETGVRIHGCTVHFVTADVDAGPIIAQAAVPVLAEDDEARLAARVLKAEHQLYPLALSMVATGRAVLKNGRVALHSRDTADTGAILLSPAPQSSEPGAADLEHLARFTP